MSNIDFNDLSPLACPLIIQPDNSKCVGDLVRELAYNLALMERALLNSVVPAGIMKWFVGKLDKIPVGYILADGSYYDPATYPALFDKLAYSYGKGAGDSFRVPDYRGTQVVGMNLGATCLNDIVDWDGFDSSGNAVEGRDTVGATNKYCQSANGDDCSSRVRQQLAIPIISTGEICL